MDGLRARWTLPAVAALLFFVNGWSDAVQCSAVADEVGGHTSAGYLYWVSGVYSGGLANFPLAQLLIALPVALFCDGYELFTDQHLLLFRLPVLLMGTALTLLIYHFTEGLFGRTAGLAAVLLAAFSPNLLAHSSLATLDAPLTFFVFLTVWAVWRYVRRPGWARMLLVGVALACALATKVQALLLIPLVLALLCAAPAAPRWSWLLLVLVPFVFVNLVYLHVPDPRGDLVPPAYVAALQMKLQHASASTATDQVAYLRGEYSGRGWWYYFPFAILVKTPVPTLALLAIGLAATRTREGLAFAVLPAAAFLGVAMTFGLNIGLRHVLAIYPFFFALAGRGAALLWGRSRTTARLLGVLGVWYIGQALWIAPHHLSYFNELAGGPSEGHRLLVGSNFDAGQDDRFLRRHIEERGLSYRINPDAFRPTTGNILVKANAFYGSYGGGGAAAYDWLERFERVDQIAHTWFEYRVPRDAFAEGWEGPRRPKTRFWPWSERLTPAQRDAALETVALFLADLGQRHAGVVSPRFRLGLGRAFVATASYANVLDEMRRILAQFPSSEAALGLGGEVMVRWKVGVLKFEGDQYLTGFPLVGVGEGRVAPDIGDVARSARSAGIAPQVSNVLLQLGDVLERRGERGAAIEQYRLALRIRPSSVRARERLEAAKARGAD